MLSEEMVAKLAVKVDAWVSAEGISRVIADRVLDIAVTDPQEERDVRKYCEDHMLSSALVDWYNKFLDFLAKQSDTAADDPGEVSPEELIETARKFRDALNLFLEKYDGK